MKRINIYLCTIVHVLLFSCDSNSEVHAEAIDTEPEQEVIKEEENNKEPENLIEQDTVKNVFNQASNGLEYRVVLYYKELYQTGKLKTVVDGMPVTMNPVTNTVFIENELLSNNSLGFFEGKYPEFIDPPETPIETRDNSLVKNKAVNCLGFEDIRAMEFLNNNRENGDLLLLISKAFFFNGAYYVHAWNFSTAPNLFHYKQCTFKFDNSFDIVDMSCANYYQVSYNNTEQFINGLKVNRQH